MIASRSHVPYQVSCSVVILAEGEREDDQYWDGKDSETIAVAV